jgi:hypothetical protein
MRACAGSRQRQWVAEIVEQHRVVLDHVADAGVGQHRRAQAAQAVARMAPAFEQVQGDGGIEQSQQRRGRRAGETRELVERARRFEHVFEHAQPHTRQQHLGVHEAGHEPEELRRTPPHHPAGQQAGTRPAVECRAGHPAVGACGEAVAPGRRRLAGERRFGGVQGGHG